MNGSEAPAGEATSRRTDADRQFYMCWSSRNPDFRRSRSFAMAYLQDLQSLAQLSRGSAYRNGHKGLLLFLQLEHPEYTHHRSLFPFRNFCKALQVFEPRPHYTSATLRLGRTGKLPRKQEPIGLE